MVERGRASESEERNGQTHHKILAKRGMVCDR